MEENKPKTGKFAFIYGLVAGAVGIIFTFMLMSVDMLYDQGIGKTLVGIAIIVAAVAIAIFQFKKSNQGFLKLQDALKVGTGTGLIAAIVSIIFTLLLTNFIVPEFWDTTYELSRATIQEQNPTLTTEQLDNAIEMQKKFSWITYPAILIFNMFVGFVVSLLAGLIMKKQRPEY